MCRWWPLITLISILLSFLAYIAFAFLCDPLGLLTDNGSAINTHTMPAYYLLSVIVTVAALLPDIVFTLYVYSPLSFP